MGFPPSPGGGTASGVSSPTDITIQSGTGLVSGDTIFKTDNVERGRFTFGGIVQFGSALGLTPAGYTEVVYAGMTFKSVGTGAADILSLYQAESTVVGTSPSGPVTGARGFLTRIVDAASVVNKTITGCANNGSGLIRVTCTGHTFATGDSIGVYGVTGTTEANGQWIVTVIDANTFDLQGSTFTNAYVSGGTATNRGSYYGAWLSVGPSQARGGLTGTAANGDDVNGVGVQNVGTAEATAGFLVNHTAAFAGGAAEWRYAFRAEANAGSGFSLLGTYTWGVDLYDNATSPPTYTGGQIRLKNGLPGVYARNAAGTADIGVFHMSASDAIAFEVSVVFNDPVTVVGGQGITLGAGTNFNLDNVTGSKIGTNTNHKLSFWNKTPIVQPTTSITGAAFVAGTGTAVNSSSTFGGYTLAQLAAVIINTGLAA